MEEGKLTDAEQKERLLHREDIGTPHQCTAEPIDPDVGVSLEVLEHYGEEFNRLVEQMMEDMTGETRILEGTTMMEYETLRKELDRENELSRQEESKQ